MSKMASFLFLTLMLCCIPRISPSAELYFLEDSQVLLYKIINWWYYAPAVESVQLCGDNVRYVNTGKSKVSYIENGSAMKISIDDGFAPMLSVVKECETCSGSYSGQSAWLNEEYFTGATSTLTIEEFAFTNEYSIIVKKIEKKAYAKFKEEEKLLVFTLTGVVQGLQDGKMAINPKSDFLEKCFESGINRLPESVAYLVVTNSDDGSTLMKFNISPPKSGAVDLRR